MKKKNKVLIILAIVLILIIVLIFTLVFKFKEKDNISVTEKVVEVSNQTIISTLTASGEVEAANIEKISLNTSYYYLTMCVEKEELVKKGENILKYTNGKYLVAPYDCVIMGINVPEVKDICTSSNYVYIASTDELNMNINISEEDIKKVSTNQEVEIVANYDETKIYKGKIIKINDIGTASSGGTNFAAIASIENDGYLKLGMSATCTITLEKDENVVALPIEAIQYEDDKKFVYKLNENNETEKIYVETGKSDANYVEITSGLSLGNKVKYDEIKVVESKKDNKKETKSITSFIDNDKGSERRGGRNR